MKRNFKAVVVLLVLALVVPILSQCSSADTAVTPEARPAASAAEPAALKVGDKAPDFTLPDQDGKQVSLSQFQGKENVVLAFYVLAFTGG